MSSSFILLPPSKYTPWGPLVPLLAQWKEEGIRYNCIKLGKNGVFQGNVHPQEIK